MTTSLVGCDRVVHPKPRAIFTNDVPQSARFHDEIKYMKSLGKFPAAEELRMDQDLQAASALFGVPRGLLWCLMFQESRLDALKNASDRSRLAKGIGQFTPLALREINHDTNHYDQRTREILAPLLKPRSLPLSFQVNLKEPARAQNHTSYYQTTTAVFATAAYLNNRYRQLERALQSRKIRYDPQVLWLYAITAYNKGGRAAYALISEQRLYNGDQATADLLKSPKMSYALLTHRELLDFSLRELWPNRLREHHVTEIARNMESIFSCAIPESQL